MSKPLHYLILLAIVFINGIGSIKLTRENLISLGGVENNFEYNRISEIDPFALEVLKSTTLNLQYNELTYLQEDLFQNNINFEDLRLYSNKVSKIHPLVFQKLQNLTSIDLQNNELTEIAENLFERNTKLRKINLLENSITFFHPNTFKNLKNLQYLNLESNLLTSFDLNLLSSNKELQALFVYNNSLTELHYHDLKLRLPQLSDVSFTKNNFNCSFVNQLSDYLDKEEISVYQLYGAILCISDEEYAAIVRARQINIPEGSQSTNRQLNLEEQCSNITMELRNIIKDLKLQLYEKESVIEKLQIDNDNKNNVIKGLKLQLVDKQSVTVKENDDSAKVKADNEIKDVKVHLQFITEKINVDIEDLKNVIKGLKTQLLEQQAFSDELKAELKSLTESCCQITI